MVLKGRNARGTHALGLGWPRAILIKAVRHRTNETGTKEADMDEIGQRARAAKSEAPAERHLFSNLAKKT